MKLPRLYSLQSRFILGLLTVIMVISIINLTALYYFMQTTMQGEVDSRAYIVLEQVDAVKSYVQSTLRPRLLDTLTKTFILEGMSSSFISRSVMERIGHTAEGGGTKDYLYRRVAINATNAAFEANEQEQAIIEYFRKNPTQKLWQGEKLLEGELRYVMARPVVYTTDCLLCHGNPADAPTEMVQQYGSGGYHHRENAIDGIDLVGVSTSHFTRLYNSRFTRYAVIYLGISMLVLSLIYLTFQRVVVVNLRTLTSSFRKNFRDQKGVELLNQVEYGDEIEEMIEGMEGLSHHLLETEQQLKDYTANLEQEVEKRTRQLQQENDKRRRDYQIFVDLLQALQRSTNRAELWQTVLPLLVKRLSLKRATYVCTFSSNQSFSWPLEGQGDDGIAQEARTKSRLPHDHISLIIEPQVRLDGNEVYVPIGASSEDIEGILILERGENSPFFEEETEQLTAIGRQLGIAAENMAALDSILRQTDNLQTIFEGITDPLLLMEENGSIVMANRAAGLLFETFADSEKDDRKASPKPILERLLNRPTAVVTSVPTENTGDSESAARDKENSESVTLPDSWEVNFTSGRSFIVNTFPLHHAVSTTPSRRQVVTVQENTEKKKMVRQVVQSEKMATVGKLAAGLAHELNNPLGVILCYAELIKKGLADEQQQADIDVVIKHTRQAQSVLLDLLNFARPKVTTSRRTVLGDIVESVTSVFRVQAAKKNVELHCIRADGGRTVYIEQQAAEHIIINLLLNGLDAIEVVEGNDGPGGKIEINVRYDERARQLILSVEDSGKGIPAHDLPLIFDPFFTTKDINKGTGLGLAVIYGYMHELGGSIEASSARPGGGIGGRPGGALFTLKFPAARQDGLQG